MIAIPCSDIADSRPEGMILLAHPTGNANVRAVARAFHRAGWLKELDSSICWDSQSLLARVLPRSLADQFNRRAFPGIPLALTHSHPWRDLMRLAGIGHRIPWLQRHENGPLSVDSIYRNFDRHVGARLPGLAGLQAVYSYEDASLHIFRAAKALQLHRFYDLPIGYWRSAQRLFAEERELQPEWANTLTGLRDSPEKLARKDEELHLADEVIVPSQFVRSTLQEHMACSAPIHVLPFGSPSAVRHLSPTRERGPLHVLYVGSLGQRKGLSYLLSAIDALGSQVHLTLIGRPTTAHCAPLNAALDRYRWIPTLPHSEILEQMRQHEVLVLPSLFEGFALVINEAISQGLPVIATPNSGAEECIRNGIEGFLVPIRSTQSIVERLQQLINNRTQLDAMRQACLERARALRWTRYEQQLTQLVGQALCI